MFGWFYLEGWMGCVVQITFYCYESRVLAIIVRFPLLNAINEAQ